MADLTRRKFLAHSVVAGAVVTLGDFTAGDARAAALQTQPAGASSAGEMPSWADKPMRWAQLTLVEDDPQPGKFDLES